MSATIIPLTTSILQPLLPISLFVLSGKLLPKSPAKLQDTNTTLKGIALALAGWVVPLLLLPTTPSRTLIHQFNEVIRRGYAYLQSSSRALALLLLTTTVLTYQLPDSTAAAKWQWYAAAGFVLVQTAWWEVVMIFPINNEVTAMEGKLKGGELWLRDREHEKLRGLIEDWRFWHFGRIATPFVAGCLCLGALL